MTKENKELLHSPIYIYIYISVKFGDDMLKRSGVITEYTNKQTDKQTNQQTIQRTYIPNFYDTLASNKDTNLAGLSGIGWGKDGDRVGISQATNDARFACSKLVTIPFKTDQ